MGFWRATAFVGCAVALWGAAEGRRCRTTQDNSCPTPALRPCHTPKGTVLLGSKPLVCWGWWLGLKVMGGGGSISPSTPVGPLLVCQALQSAYSGGHQHQPIRVQTASTQVVGCKVRARETLPEYPLPPAPPWRSAVEGRQTANSAAHTWAACNIGLHIAAVGQSPSGCGGPYGGFSLVPFGTQ